MLEECETRLELQLAGAAHSHLDAGQGDYFPVILWIIDLRSLFLCASSTLCLSKGSNTQTRLLFYF